MKQLAFKTLRWILSVFLFLSSLISLLPYSLAGVAVGIIGSLLIAPPVGAAVAAKLSALEGAGRQTLIGFVLYCVGLGLVISATLPVDKPHETVNASAQGSPMAPDAPMVAAAPAFYCEIGNAADGQTVGVLGADSHDLQNAPKGQKIINQKATKILGETHYQSIDTSTRVRVQCIEGTWAKVQIVEPDYLQDQIGWVERSVLDTPLAPGEIRDFTADAFHWDKYTTKDKKLIMQAVNRIHREDPRCKDRIEPSTASLSDAQTKQKDFPVYYVTCGEGLSAVNVYFDSKRLSDSTPFRAPGHLDESRAVNLCEEYARAKASHPQTVDFSRIMDLAVTEHPNGRTRVESSFTAKNAMNLELKFNIHCLVDGHGMIEASINEAQTR